MEKPRDESEILADLITLTTSPGYVHAIAQICHRDTSFIYKVDRFNASDMDGLFDRERLIRTEITTLLGLMVKKPIDLTEQSDEVIKNYINQTDRLMKELHDSIGYPLVQLYIEAIKNSIELPNPWQGKGLREPIFYSGEQAHAFQYRDFITDKFSNDDEWLLKNVGFTSSHAKAIAQTIVEMINAQGERIFNSLRNSNNTAASWLSTFEISLDDVVTRCGINQAIVKAFFHAFSFSGNNANFKEVGDFNEISARPLIPTGRNTVLLFSHYAIFEALYESPFFWMWEDEDYRPTANKNRGLFPEAFAANRLDKVFGSEHVYKNVDLHIDRTVVGEIDVLVIYGDRLIILQAKAKKLTIAARKGNDGQLKDDFAAAIQDSYDQGWKCAEELLAGKCQLIADNKIIAIPSTIKEIFLFSLVSEHYPALAFQVRQSLKFQTTEIIQTPFVMDVFFLDALSEMLATPLRFLSFVKLRLAAADKLMSSHELTILSYHLKHNLWLGGTSDLLMLEDSIARDLDAAMLVRRENFPGDDTPVGILTKMKGTKYESLIEQIEARADPAILELGFHLLSMGEDYCRNIHRAIEIITKQTKADGKRHDISFGTASPPSGISIHCNPIVSENAKDVLQTHCFNRKYKQRARKWFGVSVDQTGKVQFGTTLDFPWEYSENMERLATNMSMGTDVRDVLFQYQKKVNRFKLGRNEPCHCGSGLKHKKCCLL